ARLRRLRRLRRSQRRRRRAAPARRARPMRRALVLLSLVALACADDPLKPLRPDGSRLPATSDAGPPPPLSPDRRDPPRCDEELGAPIVRRLTETQLRNSLEDLFGPEVPEGDVLVDPTTRGYDADAREAVVRDVGANRVMLHAERVAAWAVEHRLEA